MKKKINSRKHLFIQPLVFMVLLFSSLNVSATNYYVSGTSGDDNNTGTSIDTPWKTLSKINAGTYLPGDQILLKCGDIWSETVVFISKFTGTAAAPIVISSYGTGDRPKVTATTGSILIRISNADYLQVKNLDIGSGIGYGIVFSVDDNNSHSNIIVDNVNVHDLTIAGIFFNTASYSNVSVNFCTGNNAEMLIAFSGGQDINITNCIATNCKYGGYSIIGINGGTMDNCKALNCGTGNYTNGACGIFLGVNNNFLVKNCEVAFQKRQGTNPDAEAVDFERSNINVKLLKCNFHDNDGCGIMFYDNNKNLVNTGCVVDSCTFTNNSLNCNIPCGFEINFTKLNNNNNGAITNNTYTLRPGIDFITTTDPSVTITGNYPTIINEPPVVKNNGFENPVISTLQYRPNDGNWIFFSNSGIQHNGSAFGAPNAPQGQQTTFLQGSSSISQSLYFKPGTYKIIFKSAYRNSSGSGQGINVSVDGKMIGNTIYPVSGTAFGVSETDSFKVREGLHIIKFAGSLSADKTAFIDDIEIVFIDSSIDDDIPFIANCGFENPGISTFQYRPIGGSWTFRSNSGVQRNGSAFGAPIAPEGVQTAFFQGACDISQLVYFTAGTYKIIFKAAYRNSSGSGQGIDVSVNNNKVGSTIFPSSGTAFGKYESDLFTVPSGNQLIQISGTYNGDKTAFLDSISILKEQVMNFSEFPELKIGDPDYELNATVSSGLPIVYSSSDTSVVKIIGNKIYILSAGTTQIFATQIGNRFYLPVSVSHTLIVKKKKQEITFDSISEKILGDHDFELIASSSSGLPVIFSSSDTNVATANGNVVHVLKSGTVTITASQVGNEIYQATDTSRVLLVRSLNILVQYQNGNRNVSDNTISPYLKIINNNSVDVDFSELGIRYWFTPENYSGINIWIDYAQIGANNMQFKYVPNSIPKKGSFGYIEYRFLPSSGFLKGLSNSGVIQSRIANQDWSPFNELDDYSFSNSESYSDNNRITLYRNGILVFGTEPEDDLAKIKFSVYCENKNHSTNKNTISTWLQIHNEGNVPVAYQDLSIRYWFTKDSSSPLTSYFDYVKFGINQIEGNIINIDPPVENADVYFELKVKDGVSYPLSNSGNIQYRISKSDWSNFDETNDYSWIPSDPMIENEKVTVYYKGNLIYGTEPYDITQVQALKGLFYKTDIQSITALNSYNYLYPNPVTGNHFYIRTAQDLLYKNIYLKITDINGRLILIKEIGKNMSGLIEVYFDHKLNNGVYVIQLNNQAKIKFVVR